MQGSASGSGDRGAARSRRFPREKLLGGEAMRLRGRGMGPHPGNLRLQQGNALIEFVSRIALEALGGEAAGGVIP